MIEIKFVLCLKKEKVSDVARVTSPSTPVGGIYIPVNKFEFLAPYIGLTILLVVAVIIVVYVKKRKRDTERINSQTNNQRTS